MGTEVAAIQIARKQQLGIPQCPDKLPGKGTGSVSELTSLRLRLSLYHYNYISNYSTSFSRKNLFVKGLEAGWQTCDLKLAPQYSTLNEEPAESHRIRTPRALDVDFETWIVWAKLNLSGCIKLLHISLSGSMAKHVQLSSFVS